MKKILSTFILSVLAFVLHAQGIAFEPEGTTLEQAAAKAKKENKLVFVDCYTQWCGPCRNMAKNIFPQEKVGTFMNSRFVSLKLDMETAYAAPLAKKWQVAAYPTFIIFNGDAQEIGRFVGGCDADEFIKRVTEKSRDNGSAALEERWNKGERDEAFLKEYLSTLNAAYKNDQANLVAEALLKGKEDTFAGDKDLSMVFMRNINNPFASVFVHTVRHPEALKAALGDQPVDMKIKSVLSGYPRQLILQDGDKVSLDENKFNAYVELLRSLNIPDAEHYRLTVLITAAEKGQDYDTYIRLIEEYLATPGLDADDMTLARWVQPFAKANVGDGAKQKMISVLRTRVKEIESGKREAQTRMGNMILSKPTDELLKQLIGVLETGGFPQTAGRK